MLVEKGADRTAFAEGDWSRRLPVEGNGARDEVGKALAMRLAATVDSFSPRVDP